MIKPNLWRLSKMFPSNSKLTLAKVNLKTILVMFVVAVLSACTTLTSEQGREASSVKTEELVEKPAATQTDSANSLLAFAGKDPMADIQINPEIRQSYAQVAKLVANNNFAQALGILDEVKLQYPQLSGPDYQKARIFLQQQKLEQASQAIDLSLMNNQSNYYALNLKGVILREQGKFNEAKQAYLKAIEIYPPYPNSHLNLGVLADIYLRDSALALIKYQQYQSLTKGADNKVKNWIIEIERRIKAGG
jgi:Flp pilus assembly protein TadD